ncbi:MAG TPA: CRISPR-associated endonuclease Cas2 [Leptospiraceae bacterium]|nr:CRISPR-associated endonuclease Cas2 [Leptospiraceae bacterium]HMW08298.1 CRISPR-associated endonuclease Cas2 [Leptospiraceae bacterium]HMY34195.1 CRISPR-associated endonuclease Cas2 [Leptospiraceae bacterium]HMZ67053.1 CRISPR-associated endonuclease Cas2 [Leptospiraceae bacterium]HNA09561.1 CRISPR-associated endonuclease Cas2 [Leptospiraceae bacterium]
MRDNWIISYDISDPKRLRKVAKFLEGYGERIQHSLFRVQANDRDIEKIKFELTKKIAEEDSVFYLRFCNLCAQKVHKLNPKLDWKKEDVTFRIV